jgi:hypothetical protein
LRKNRGLKKEMAPSWVLGACTQRVGGGRGLTAWDAVCLI